MFNFDYIRIVRIQRFLRLAVESNVVAGYTYSRPPLGIATNETVSFAGVSHDIVRGLDEYQRLRQLTVDGQDSATYSYDVENCLSAVSNAAFSVDYHYTSEGYEAGYSVTLTNGIVLSRALTHDLYRRGLIKTITNTVDGVAVNPLAYSYDLLNRATSRNTDSFGYNARSEVASASILSNAYTFAYDFIGNHTASSVNSVETIYAANNLNQYTSILCAPAPLREPSYDLDGNMTANGAWSYTWDAENRLKAAYSNNVCVVSNAYDYMSRRVAKWTPSHTTTFVYDGWNLVLETVSTASGVSTNTYVWGKDLSGSLQGAGGVGGLLAVSLNGTWYFPFYDNNGNITAYADESGNLVAEYAYDAFGETIAQSGSMADVFHHRFSTKYFETETSLYYYGYRFYSPDIHRWLSRDPFGERGGNNLYAFVLNSPILLFDPLGLTKFSKAQAWFTRDPSFFLKLTATEGEDCARVNFIQVMNYNTGQTIEKLQLDKGTPRLMAPLYFDKTSVDFKEFHRNINYPQEILFGDGPSSWPEIDRQGEDMSFLVLIVDAYSDRAEVLGAVAWAYVGKESDNKLWLYGVFRNGTKEEVETAVQVLTPNNFKPFGGKSPAGGYKIDTSKFKNLPGIEKKTFKLLDLSTP